MKIMLEQEVKDAGYPDCFGRSLGGTECWESCGGDGFPTYVRCLLQGKALIDEALEAELLENEN